MNRAGLRCEVTSENSCFVIDRIWIAHVKGYLLRGGVLNLEFLGAGCYLFTALNSGMLYNHGGYFSS